ncbi:hypothetical protein AB0N05_15050 [Nocardia sp. NPDC051030]|uniref:hypothetical protein n=1 Tax=Nocardia sp. NPDC051030 TaxID=3155162 RepID=UPI003437786F
MSPERDFGHHNHDDDQPDNPEEDHPEMPQPQPEPDDDQAGADPAIEAPKPPSDHFDVDTPSAGELYAMFPDALPKNHPARRNRHLAAVPDPNDLATLPADTRDDTDDPLIGMVLRLRFILTLWLRPAATAITVVVIAACAFGATGVVVGIAWCTYGIGWITHSIWHVHGRPSLHQLYANRRGGAW